MGNGFQFIDIILIAVIALFLVARLRNALGRRDGHDTSNENNVFKISDSLEPQKEEHKDEVVHDPSEIPDLDVSLKSVSNLDPSFDQKEFLAGAEIAFEMILNAYAASDIKPLKELLSADVFDQFHQVIQDREKVGETVEDVLVKIETSKIVEVYIEARSIFLTVEFLSQQVNATRNKEGEVIDGDANMEISVRDFWTFSRNTRANNPNWTLVQTKSLE